MRKIIVHVSEVDISLKSGMGRVEYYWKNAFEEAGFTFIHIGPNEIKPVQHPYLFSHKAYRYYKSLNVIPNAFIVHEPVSKCFIRKQIPCFIESHGIERRAWEGMLDGLIPFSANYPLTLRRKLLFPLWRLSGCDKGLRNAHKLLLINNEDRQYAKGRYRRNEGDIYVFQNGVFPSLLTTQAPSSKSFTILFNGSWVERKGTHILIKAAEILFKQNLEIDYLLIGTGQSEEAVIEEWPEKMRSLVNVVPTFNRDDECGYINSATLFVLPSFFEGQPLSLLQAMAAGKCCITTNSCGQKDIIVNGENGILVNAGNFVELAMQIKRCYNDRSLVQKIGNNAKKSTYSLSWERVSKNVVDYVSENI